MSVEFQNSETMKNLMRAFSGESQARNRYTFAASIARKENLYVVEAVFNYTAGQEKEHAEIFYNHLKELSGKNITIDGGYPVDISDSTLTLLKCASRNEYEEHDTVYRSFGETAATEGFPEIAASFNNIAKIEKLHGDRFKCFAELLEDGKLFVSDVKCSWICLNCGYVFEGEMAPKICPVCSHDQGYFIRLELSPFSK